MLPASPTRYSANLLCPCEFVVDNHALSLITTVGRLSYRKFQPMVRNTYNVDGFRLASMQIYNDITYLW
jgi:hypothetical protein